VGVSLVPGPLERDCDDAADFDVLANSAGRERLVTTAAGDNPVHALGSKARVLLTSVFGPYARDDQYGSRLINPMELYHNQVTRVQHAFSLRAFHRSWGLMLIQVNIEAPCVLLDFPSEERFVAELQARRYDIIGISAIMTNIFKVRRMGRLIRKHQPHATILVGGHIANVPDLKRWVDVDHVVAGEGVRWMRRFLGEDEDRPVLHPRVMAYLDPRMMGVPLTNYPGLDEATLIPSVGCPKGCNFCSTSALFGGKGKHIDFYHSGDELFEIMRALEADLGVRGFFVMDENFLIQKKRALRLLSLMEEHGKPWHLKVFSSADVLQHYTIDQLIALGVSWVWLGLEGKNSQYAKLAKTDTIQLVRSLQSHGIHVLGSSIIGLEEHTPENIDEVIDHAIAHDSDLHQFMLYTPIPGTPLHAAESAKGTLLGAAEFPVADIHGQLRFNFRHPHIRDGQEGEYLLRAFHRDFAINGPSVVRIIRTTLRGWKRYNDHPDARVRARFAHEASSLSGRCAAALWAAQRFYQDDPHRSRLIASIQEELYAELGRKARVAARVAGPSLECKLRAEEQRLQDGWTYEPPTFFETNADDGPATAVRVSGVIASPSKRLTHDTGREVVYSITPMSREAS
jgi:hypothetical protein